MSALVATRHDSKRGCGYRKAGGMYLVSGGPSVPCGKLPVYHTGTWETRVSHVLAACPTCSGGVKPSRGWTWVDADTLLADSTCPPATCNPFCPMARSMGRAGLLWIGGKFYERPQDWTDEAVKHGVSRRISQVPRELKIGETWVLVAHRKAIAMRCPDCEDRGGAAAGVRVCETCGGSSTIYAPGIFHAFKPTAIEYVVKGTETEEELQALIKRGITPVRVEVEQGSLAMDDAEDETEVEA